MIHQIILLGKTLSTVYTGLKEFGPDVIHLLFTDETAGVFQPMVQMLPKSTQVKTYKVPPYDIEAVRVVCREIQDEVGDVQVQYNLSEGTKIMAMAALEVARERHATAFYITQEGEIVDLIANTRRRLFSSIDNQEFVRLSGSSLYSYSDIRTLSKEDIDCSKAIKRFIELNGRDYDALQFYCRRRTKGHCGKLPEFFEVSNGLKVNVNGGGLVVRKKGKTLLNEPNKNACWLLFNGRWWESLVAQQVRKWMDMDSSVKREAWQGVIFEDEEERKMKNEIDILVNDRQKLIVIECKSGFITQDDIYHIDAVRETYGGDVSKAVLASYYPLDEMLLEKCRDVHIHVFAPQSRQERIGNLERMPKWLDSISGVLEI